jgi:PAS domain S-box-containing protein
MSHEGEKKATFAHQQARTEETLDMLWKSIDVASDAVFWLDKDARFVYVNQSACQSVGYARDELLSMKLCDVNPHSTVEGWDELLKQIRNVGTVHMESEHRRRDGTLFPVEIVSTYVVVGGREYVNGFARDITERKQAESALRQRIAELSALQTTVLEITTPHELSGLLQTIVERATRLLNADGGAMYLCDPQSRTARCVVSYNTPRDFSGITLRYGEGAAGVVAETGRPLLIDDYRTWSGRAAAFDSEQPFRAVATAPLLWQGQVTGVIHALRFRDSNPFTQDDLRLLSLFANHAAIAAENARLREGLQRELAERTRREEERLDLERRMLSAQKLESLGLLAGGVAHDFNNLLAVILGYAEMLKTQLPEVSEAATCIEEIIKAAGRSRDLTRQLLAIGRRQALRMEPVDLNRVIRGSESLLRRTVRESITLELHSTPSLGLIMADAGQIEQIVLNLAANAQDAMPHGGRLRIETREETIDEERAKRIDVTPGIYVLLTVADTGQGMSAETLLKIFDPFFTTKAEGKGTGLGLPTVYGIVKQHGGGIHVQSEPRKGTRFEICFPRTEALPARKNIDAPQGAHTGAETVIVVEDQDQLRTLICRQLLSSGYTVLDARDGASAIRIVSEHDGVVHLLVTDVVLPGMNGRELFDRLARERAGLKVLFMSGYAGDILSENGVAIEGLDLLQKPFTLQDFAAKVREVLRRA